MASKKKLVVAMASSVVGLWSGRSSPARLFVGLGGAAVLDMASSEYGLLLLLRPSFGTAGMAVERAARWATPASAICAAAAGDEQADLGVARAGFSELQSLELGATAVAFFVRTRRWRGVWRGVFLAPKPPWA